MADNSAQSDVERVIRKQLAQYIIEWRRGGSYDFAVGVRDLSFLERHAAARGARVMPLEGKQGTCHVVTDVDCADLWVRASPSMYGGYRTAFVEFAKRYHGVSFSGGLGGYDVDHLFNAARAKAYGVGYVRVGLVEAVANRSWGRTFESRIGGREKDRHKNVFLATPIIFAKILGLRAPQSNLHVTVVIDQIAAHLLAVNAIDHSEVEDIKTGTMNLFMRAYRDTRKSFGEMDAEDYFGG